MLNLFLSIIRMLFALIDTLVVWLIKNLYLLLVQIANTNVFGDFIYAILGRIYVFLGIFMLFKLTMSMITYIINPDTMTDKSKGFGKLITNVVISLILVVTVPSIFREAFRVQYMILNSNAIYRIVTGRELNTVTSDSGEYEGKTDLEKNALHMGNTIATEVYSLFIYKAEGSVWTFPNEVSKPVDEEGDECPDINCMLRLDVINNTKDGEDDNFGFTNVYWFILSTIAGGVVCYFFLVFCLDAATRSIKLGALQIVAPIPILSMIDPQAGTEKVKKWATECGREFAGLFIRLAGVFFAIAIIQMITDANEFNAFMQYGPDGGPSNNPVGLFVKLFIIIGALMFAKQLPQWIESVLGFKLSGDGFNLKKRLSGMPGMGAAKVLGAGALGFAGGMAANAWATRGNWKGQGFRNGLKNVGSILAGGVSAGARGLTSKEKSMWKAADGGIKGAVGARNLRDERQATGEGGIQGWYGRRIGDIDKFAGTTDDESAKIAAKRSLGDQLFNDYKGNNKYSMGGSIGTDFGKAWQTADKAKDYRNKINSQLSIARSDFQAGKSISWNGKTGSEAIAALEVESAKASAAYDKASADFKELRSMKEHKAETTYYEAYSAADDRASAAEFASKNPVTYSSQASSPIKKGGKVVGTAKVKGS